MSEAVSFRRRRGRVSDRVFEGVWLFLGLVALVDGFLELISASSVSPKARNAALITIAFGVFAAGTAITHAFHKSAFRFVGGFAGAVLGLYGIALILLGHEDVGGLRVALPFGLAAIILGAWSFVLAASGESG